jgi:hypothetical protein
MNSMSPPPMSEFEASSRRPTAVPTSLVEESIPGSTQLEDSIREMLASATEMAVARRLDMRSGANQPAGFVTR